MSAEAVTTLEHNKQLVRRWFDEVWNQSRRETIFDLFDQECVLHEGHTPIRGPQEFAAFHDRIRDQFDYIRIEPGVAVAEGDLVSIRWNLSAVHKGTGKRTVATGISIARVKDGRFVEAWQNWDEAGVAAQLA